MKTCHRYLSNFKVFFITDKQYLYDILNNKVFV